MHAAQLALVITVMEYEDWFDVVAASPTMIEAVTSRLAGGRPGQKVTLDTIRVAAIAPYATQIQEVSFTKLDGNSGITLDGVAQVATSDIVPAATKSIHLASVSIVDGKNT